MWHLILQLIDDYGFEFDRQYCNGFSVIKSDTSAEQLVVWDKIFHTKQDCLEWVSFLNNSIVYLPFSASANKYILDNLLQALKKDNDCELTIGTQDANFPYCDLWEE